MTKILSRFKMKINKLTLQGLMSIARISLLASLISTDLFGQSEFETRQEDLTQQKEIAKLLQEIAASQEAIAKSQKAMFDSQFPINSGRLPGLKQGGLTIKSGEQSLAAAVVMSYGALQDVIGKPLSDLEMVQTSSIASENPGTDASLAFTPVDVLLIETPPKDEKNQFSEGLLSLDSRAKVHELKAAINRIKISKLEDALATEATKFADLFDELDGERIAAKIIAKYNGQVGPTGQGPGDAVTTAAGEFPTLQPLSVLQTSADIVALLKFNIEVRENAVVMSSEATSSSLLAEIRSYKFRHAVNLPLVENVYTTDNIPLGRSEVVDQLDALAAFKSGIQLEILSLESRSLRLETIDAAVKKLIGEAFKADKAKAELALGEWVDMRKPLLKIGDAIASRKLLEQSIAELFSGLQIGAILKTEAALAVLQGRNRYFLRLGAELSRGETRVVDNNFFIAPIIGSKGTVLIWYKIYDADFNLVAGSLAAKEKRRGAFGIGSPFKRK